MITPLQKKVWEKQHYRIIGSHSAVKTCHWTKNMVKGGGGCYKLKFYGIMSNQCMQMTTSMSCANRCSFCWRDDKAPVSKEWKWEIDAPELILTESLNAHHKLLLGYKDNEVANKSSYKSSKTVKHVALSLTGEPITYPKINELNPVTQLYVSVDAPTRDLLENIDKPLFKDYWERFNRSLEYLSQKKQRTCIRLTLIKSINMLSPEKYAELIMKGNPDFIEAKAYMHMGASQERLERSNMPEHEEVLSFSRELKKYLPDYEVVSEHIPSRVVMLAKKKFKIEEKWHTWIDFPKYNELVKLTSNFSAKDYLKPTPSINIIK